MYYIPFFQPDYTIRLASIKVMMTKRNSPRQMAVRQTCCMSDPNPDNEMRYTLGIQTRVVLKPNKETHIATIV
jgi:hypothetical protein